MLVKIKFGSERGVTVAGDYAYVQGKKDLGKFVGEFVDLVPPLLRGVGAARL